MKHFFLSLLIAIMGFFHLPVSAQSFLYEYNGQKLLYYIVNEGQRTCEVGSNRGIKGDLVIPATVVNNGIPYSVINIFNSAFSSSDEITSVKIEEGITRIGWGAFFGCSGIISLEIPNSVTQIDSYAFQRCTGLTSIRIPTSVASIGYYAFSECSGLTSLEIPNSITSIEPAAFSECSGLTSIVIPNSVTSIGKDAFRGCSSLPSLEIPNSVTLIKDGAFSGCSSIKEITIVDGESSIDVQADIFDRVEPEIIYLGRNISYVESSPFKENPTLQRLIIGNMVTSIESGAFSGCSGLASLEIPNSITSIKEDAFSGCTGLASLEIPNSVTSIKEEAFYGCSGLSSVVIPNSITSIEGAVFADCTGLTSLEIPNSVSSIGSSAFYGCTGLTSLEIPNSVSSIGSYAFYGCTGLTSLEIPNSVSSIGSYAFKECREIKEVTIMEGDSVIKFEKDVFKGVNLKDLYMGRDISGAPFQNRPITNLTIGNKVTFIDDEAFSQCYYLKELFIPKSVKVIGDKAFYHCSDLRKVTIEDSWSYIGYYGSTFENVNLQMLYLGRSPLCVDKFPYFPKISTSNLIIGTLVYTIEHVYFPIGLINIWIYTPNPPDMGNHTFNSYTCETAQLHVIKGTKYEYTHNDRWKNFPNITDDLVSAQPFPKVKYGDNPLNLNDYEIPGRRCTYISTNPDVAKVEGNLLYITGAGESDINSYSGSTLLNTRTLMVDKVDLNVHAPQMIMALGEEVPELTLTYDGFVNGESETDIDELPVINTDNIDFSSPGIYKLEIVGGSDRNYSFVKTDGQLTVLPENGESYVLTYTYSRNNTNVVGFSAAGSADVVIPEYVEKNGIKYTVTGIAASAFAGKDNLVSIYIPSTVRNIQAGAFADCTNLETVNFNAENVNTEYNHYLNPIFENCKKLKNLNILSNVSKISNYMFMSVEIDRLEIPDNVTELNVGCFAEARNLSDIWIGKGVEKISDSAFALEKVSDLETTLHWSAKSVLYYAGNVSTHSPMRNRKVVAIEFGPDVESLIDYALHDINNARDIYCQGILPPAVSNGGMVMKNVDRQTCILHVPQESLDVYKNEYFWRYFLNVKGDVDSTSAIEDLEAEESPEDEIEIYDLNGLKKGNSTDHLLPGIYIVRKGTNISKIMIDN